MDREVCGVCGAWKGDDELIALRQDLAAARALLKTMRDAVYWLDVRDDWVKEIAEVDSFLAIDAALAGQRREGEG